MNRMAGHQNIECSLLHPSNVQRCVDDILHGEYRHVHVIGDSPLCRIRVLEAIADSPRFLTFRICGSEGLSGAEAVAVARIVRQITEFMLDTCAFTDETARTIADAVRASSTLVSLFLVHIEAPLHAVWFTEASETCESLVLGSMSFSAENAERIASSFWPLKSLYLNDIQGCERLVHAIAGATELRELSLASGELSAEDTLVVCRAMEHLTQLTLVGFKLDAAVLCSALSQKRPALQKLSIGYAYPKSELAGVMECVGHVAEARISNTDLRDVDAARSLARAISQSTTLRKINVEQWDFGDAGFVAVTIAEAVEANGGIQALEMSGYFGNAVAYAVASAVSKSPQLETLNLGGGNTYSPAAMEALAAAIAAHSRLTDVEVNSNTPEMIVNAVERSKANAALLAEFSGMSTT
jgi:hypothetical protein